MRLRETRHIFAARRFHYQLARANDESFIAEETGGATLLASMLSDDSGAAQSANAMV